ncbi:hypothetical protein XM25_00780 [Devosia sp. H5989]|nr:hypothetical protein XM25_00780 [Devosia sp. H5989]
MSNRSNGLGQTEVEGVVVKTTDAAVLYDVDGGNEVWIPRRVILGGGSVEEDDADLSVADWWLKQERLL